MTRLGTKQGVRCTASWRLWKAGPGVASFVAGELHCSLAAEGDEEQEVKNGQLAVYPMFDCW